MLHRQQHLQDIALNLSILTQKATLKANQYGTLGHLYFLPQRNMRRIEFTCILAATSQVLAQQVGSISAFDNIPLLDCRGPPSGHPPPCTGAAPWTLKRYQ